jgi:hypothetical protein
MIVNGLFSGRIVRKLAFAGRQARGWAAAGNFHIVSLLPLKVGI